ncbi:cytochrome c oxidase subunit II [Streptomyces viridochromogenes]|uniref:Cytochrome aa3 subunit 2 n=1 Tax=Streptomyces viridochromogenes Tue57 TaxID=1160705 RepID=L8P6D3_STRVR|nr:cytochrome c oxidase subunit II [Streptomyces viridochromogenes]ELS50892.1 putative Heme/copper-type cytochrome/quinol oxidase, subunit 2 [Streptomyces viridochromogenes Tue57]
MNQRHVFGEVFGLESVIAGLVFAVVLFLLAYAVIRRRAGRRPSASPRAERPRLEAFYVGALAAFAAFLVAWTAWQNHREHEVADAAPVRVDVTGFQWCWTFTYPQSPHRRSVTGNCRGDNVPTVVVPTGRPVQLHLTSRDVIHSLWVPELRYKMDAFPHHVNTFTITLDKEGRWMGKCAEFCGLLHSKMHFWLKAVSPEEYDRWLQGQTDSGGGAAA